MNKRFIQTLAVIIIFLIILGYSSLKADGVILTLYNQTFNSNILIGINQLYYVIWYDGRWLVSVNISCKKNKTNLSRVIFLSINNRRVISRNFNSITASNEELSRYDLKGKDRFTISCGISDDSESLKSIDLLKLYTDYKPRIRRQNTYLINTNQTYDIDDNIVCEVVLDYPVNNFSFYMSSQGLIDLNIQPTESLITPNKVKYSIELNNKEINQTYVCCLVSINSTRGCISASFYSQTLTSLAITNQRQTIFTSIATTETQSQINNATTSAPFDDNTIKGASQANYAPIIIGVVCGVTILILIIVSALIVYFCLRRNKKASQINRNLTRQAQQNDYTNVSTILFDNPVEIRSNLPAPSAPPRESIELSNQPPPSYSILFN